jgi:hypothetical protein
LAVLAAAAVEIGNPTSLMVAMVMARVLAMVLLVTTSRVISPWLPNLMSQGKQLCSQSW